MASPDKTPTTECPECFGKGLTDQDDRPGVLLNVDGSTTECPRCHGTGLVASPDKTPQRPQSSAIARPAEWESYAWGLEAEVVRLRAALREALELERSFVHKDGAHSATVKVLEAALVASPDKPPEHS